MPKKAKAPSFEEQLQELEQLVQRLEGGMLPLEESLVLYERGIRLSRQLQASLKAANLRVTKLLEGDEDREVPLDAAGAGTGDRENPREAPFT